MKRALLVLLLLAVAAPAHAQATLDGDYDVSSKSWNGLSTWARVVDGLGLELDIVTTLEWSDLGEQDILVLLYPLRRVDPGKVADFVHAGGHVIVGDDFGEAGDAMPVPGMGWFSVCTDSEGNEFGLWQTDPSASMP